MKCFWISWYSTSEIGGWELHSPWWISGYDINDARIVCAAVRAEDEDAAKSLILSSYDSYPSEYEVSWRFCEERPEDWSPFSSRFRRAEWMQW